MNLSDLIRIYSTDPDSTFHRLRYHIRTAHAALLRRIGERHGPVSLQDIKARSIVAWHRDWIGPGGSKVAAGHAFIAQLRTMVNFGATMLEDREALRLAQILYGMRFQSSSPHAQRITADQATALRYEAHKEGWFSIALGQAFQFEVVLRQKDVIGEWVPESKPGASEMLHKGEKNGSAVSCGLRSIVISFSDTQPASARSPSNST
jgi:hypothetical protein